MSTFGAERVSVLARAPGGTVRLGLLRGFRLEHDGVTFELPLGIQRLVAFLAVHNRPLLRLYVAGNLWIDSSEEHASANLRTALWRLHTLGFHLVDATRSHLSLASGVGVDLHDSSRRARQVLRHEAAPTRESLDVILNGGDLLPDWYDEWVLVEREQFRQLRLLALETLCRDLSAAHSYAEAVEAALACIVAEPLRESAHRALIGAHLAEGNRVEAIRQFRLYEALVRDELGVEPSAAIRHMVEGTSGDGTVTTAR
jgi:DNA-binding SARP family transcriptional activator